MSWKIELKDASFKGKPFKVDIAELQFGFDIQADTINVRPFEAKEGSEFSRLQGTESTPFVDVGERLPNQFTITAHFSGLNYKDARDDFIKAIREGGEGELILPTFSPITVVPGKAAVQFNNREGGWETIKVQFVEFNAKQQPSESNNTQGAAIDGIDEEGTNIISQFGLALSSGATWVSDASTELTENVSETINDTLGLGAVGDGLEALTAASEELAQNATTLIYTPTVLADKIYDAVNALTFAFNQPTDAFNAQIQLFENYTNGQTVYPTASTETGQAVIDNQNSFNQIVQNLALAEAGRSAVLIDYTTQEEAQTALDTFESAVRIQQLENGNTSGGDENYFSLAEILSLVSAHITAQSNLPSLVEIISGGTALALAEDLYGDAERADEIVDRNNVRNPLFLPRELEVLSF
jgi:prophage DNA circulation protein